MTVLHQTFTPESVATSLHLNNYGQENTRLNRWSLLMALMIMLISLMGCAHTSWGDGHADGERYYYFIKSNYQEMKKQDQAALKSMTKASDLDNNSSYLKLEIARLHSRNGDEANALKNARESIDLNPISPTPRLFAAWIAAAGGRWAEALSFYQQVLNLDPKNVEALTHLGALYGETGQLKKAEATFKKLVSVNPSFLSYYYLGRFYSGTGQPEEAIRAYSRSIKENPQFVAALTELAELYEKTDNWAGAERSYLALIKIVPDTSLPSLRLVNVLLKNNRRSEAEKIIQKITGQETVLTQIGMVYMDQDRFVLAAKEFEASLAKNSADDSARYFLASAQLEQEKVEKAHKNLKLISPQSDMYVDAQLLLAYSSQGPDEKIKQQKALKIITEATKLFPQQPRLKLALALILEEMGETTQARDILIKEAQAFPQIAEIHFRLGVLEDKLGDKSASIKAMQRTIDLNPNHADALNYLAYTWAEQQENLPQALAMAQRADFLKPNSGYIIDTLAWIYFHMGETAKALELLQKAVPLSGQDPVILDHLGDAYLRMGKTEKATEAYNQALEKGSTNPEALHEKIKRLGN